MKVAGAVHDIDIITIFHNDRNFEQAMALESDLRQHEVPDRYQFILMDNSVNNRGFARACNLGASSGEAEVIGFINPDATIQGPFISAVQETFRLHPNAVITGNSYGKPARELAIWGVKAWVCGAAMFVRRSFFEEVGGFDERFTWSFEDTDLCRQAESCGAEVLPIELPILHESPTDDSGADTRYKRHHFTMASNEYYLKWRR